jgi:2'-5' RNA ligase
VSQTNGCLRCFIAVPLPLEIKKYCQDLQEGLRSSGLRASWPKPEAMHLTVKFLGKLPVHRMDVVKVCMETAAAKTPVHRLCAVGMGVFPSIKNPRVIWSGTGGRTDLLEDLAGRLDTLLNDRLGIQRENRRFSAHLTLARIKKNLPPQQMIHILQGFQDRCSMDFSVQGISFFTSRLASSGAVHRNVFSAPFRG